MKRMHFELEVDGGWVLDEEQVDLWKQRDGGVEYDYYVEMGWFDEDTLTLLVDPLPWMTDDVIDGPFDFKLRPSQDHTGIV